MIEYRATGGYTPNNRFVKLSDVNVWVRQEQYRNDLEKEICAYDKVIFPKRPPSMDEAFALREQRSLFRRKLRLKGLENPDGTLKNGLDFELLFREDQEKKKMKDNDETKILDENSRGDEEDEMGISAMVAI